MGNEAKADITVRVRSDPVLLCSVRGMVAAYFKRLGLEEQRIEEIVLAVDEACANAMRHSYAGKTGEVVEVELAVRGRFAEIIVQDSGIPADPERVAPKQPVPVQAEEVGPGGLGLPLMYRVFDEVEFCPGERQGNRVRMRLRMPRAGKAKRKSEG